MNTDQNEKGRLKDQVLTFLEERKLSSTFYSIRDTILINIDLRLVNLIKSELIVDKYIAVDPTNHDLISITYEGSKFIESGGYNGILKKRRQNKYKWTVPIGLTCIIIIISIISLLYNNSLKNDIDNFQKKITTIDNTNKDLLIQLQYYNNPQKIAKEIQGMWAEVYKEKNGEGNNYGLAYFQFDSTLGDIKFYGDAYNENKKWIGKWESECSVLNGRIFRYSYFGLSENEEPLGKDRSGNGEINFEGKIGEFNFGHGFYMANVSDKVKRDFDIYKVPVIYQEILKEHPCNIVSIINLIKQ